MEADQLIRTDGWGSLLKITNSTNKLQTKRYTLCSKRHEEVDLDRSNCRRFRG